MLMGYLIGEVTSASPILEEVRQGIWQRLTTGDSIETWKLENGDFFLRGLTMVTYIQITGSTQRTSRDSEVKWQHILSIDGATDTEEGTTIIESRGVPLGYRSWSALGTVVRPFRSLCRILLEGIMPVLLEVAGLAGCPPPLATRLSGPEGIFKVRMVLHPLPPPPLSIHPQSYMEAKERHM